MRLFAKIRSFPQEFIFLKFTSLCFHNQLNSKIQPSAPILWYCKNYFITYYMDQIIPIHKLSRKFPWTCSQIQYCDQGTTGSNFSPSPQYMSAILQIAFVCLAHRFMSTWGPLQFYFPSVQNVPPKLISSLSASYHWVSQPTCHLLKEALSDHFIWRSIPVTLSHSFTLFSSW
jgi:hypothetical protein